MSQGIQVFDANGNLTFSTPDRLGRVIYVGPLNTSGIPNAYAVSASAAWVQVVPPSQAYQLWAYVVPNYQIDPYVENKSQYVTQEHYKLAYLSIDPVNHPGCLWCNGEFYNSDTGTLNDYPYQNSTLIYGVY